jgi:hypothetical protein
MDLFLSTAILSAFCLPKPKPKVANKSQLVCTLSQGEKPKDFPMSFLEHFFFAFIIIARRPS